MGWELRSDKTNPQTKETDIDQGWEPAFKEVPSWIQFSETSYNQVEMGMMETLLTLQGKFLSSTLNSNIIILLHPGNPLLIQYLLN